MTAWMRVGEVEIGRIVEQEVGLRPALDTLPGLTPEVLALERHWLQPRAMDMNDALTLRFQSYVLRTPHHTILVDSCIGNDKDRPARPQWHMKSDTAFMDGLAALGLRVEDIDYVMCTHLHVDHVGWNTRLVDGRWVPTFPRARYVFGQAEYAYWEAENARAANPIFEDSVLPVVAAGQAELVGGAHGVGDHVRLMPTPGHTPGHVSVLVGRGGTDAFVSGDMIHFPLQARYPELSSIFDVDPAAAATTRRAVLEQFCDTATLCCWAHFPAPSLGRVKRWHDGFRCDTM